MYNDNIDKRVKKKKIHSISVILFVFYNHG